MYICTIKYTKSRSSTKSKYVMLIRRPPPSVEHVGLLCNPFNPANPAKSIQKMFSVKLP